jgi:glycosyltransferase involved in cell wall biosynthesis
MVRHLLDDPRIRYVKNETRTGLIAQRNQALELSRAKLVAVLDADDVAKPGRLATQFAYLEEHPEVKVLGSWLEIIDEHGKVVGLRRYPATHEEIARAIRRFNPIAQPAVIFHRELGMTVGGYQGEPYAEDYDLWARMFVRGAKFANVPATLVQYRLHGETCKKKRLRELLYRTIVIKKYYFRSDLTWFDRLRLLAEYGLLWMPPGLVYWLFQRVTFQKSCRCEVSKF